MRHDMTVKMLFLLFVVAISVLVPLSLFSQRIAAGGRHSLAICADSTVRAWGYNGYGQLGNGTKVEQHTSVPVFGLTGVTQVAGGLFHSLFVKNDSTVWACGRNPLGPLGDGTSVDRTTPVQVQGLSGIVHVAGGGEHSLFVRSDGTAWACGANASGQLGDGTNSNRYTAVQVRGLTGIIQVAGGAEFSLFLQDDGTVWACGNNSYGQFGNGTTTSSKVPVKVGGLSSIVQISAGEWHSLFVMKDGSVYSSGRNQYGQLGDGTTIDRSTASRVSSLSDIVQAEAGGIHSVFVRSDGTVWSCGLNSGGNNNGQLGDGTVVDRSTPVMVLPSWGSGRIVHAEATREHSLYEKDNGEVWGSGRNNYGQLGYGAFTTANSSTSVLASTVCSVVTVAVRDPKPHQAQILVYPHPFSSEAVVRAEHPFENAVLTIINSYGQIIRQMNNVYGETILLQRDDIVSGLYFVRITQNDTIVASCRLVVAD